MEKSGNLSVRKSGNPAVVMQMNLISVYFFIVESYCLPNTGIDIVRKVICSKLNEGGHGAGKTGNLDVNFSRQGKHREFS